MDEQAVVQAYREGKKAASIEAEYHLTPGRLYRLLRKHGVPLRTKGGWGEDRAEATAHRIPFRCECGHEWEEEVYLPMQVDAFLARARGWSVCPRCGGKKVSMLMKEPNPFYKEV